MGSGLQRKDSRPGGRQPFRSRKSRRLWIVMMSLACFSAAAGLMLRAFSSDIVFFMAPSQIIAHPPRADQTIRLGGMVVAGSLRQEAGPEHQPQNRFDITDGQKAVTVLFVGVLPDLFREGQSVVAVGMVGPDRVFRASEVLAKHDETYMPREVAEALRKSGKWDPRFGKPPEAAEWDTMTRAQAKKVMTQASNAL